MFVVLLRREAKMKIALVVSSPAVNNGIVGLGGLASRVTISVAACFRKSVMVTSGKFSCLGRKVTVSASTLTLV